MLNKLLNKKLVEKAYVVSLVVFVLSSIMMSYFVYSNTMDTTVLRFARYAALGIAIFKILGIDCWTYSRRRAVISIVTLVILMISGFVSGNRILLWTAIMIIAFYRVDFSSVLKNLFVWEIMLVIIIILLSVIGIVPDRVFPRDGQVVRHSLGFKYSTYLPLLFLGLATIHLYLRRSRIGLIECVVILFASFIIYELTDTRLEPALVVCLTLSIYLYNRFGNDTFKKYIFKISLIVVPFAIVVSLLSVTFFDSESDFWKKINSFTSNRIGLSSKVMNEYGITFFGNDISWVGLSNIYEGEGSYSEYNAVDNAYLRILVQFGAVAMMLFVLSQSVMIAFARERGDYRLQLILIMFVIFSILNPHTYELAFCPFLIMLGDLNKCRDEIEGK